MLKVGVVIDCATAMASMQELSATMAKVCWSWARIAPFSVPLSSKTITLAS